MHLQSRERAVKLGFSEQDILLMSVMLLTTSIWLFSILLGCYRNTGDSPEYFTLHRMQRVSHASGLNSRWGRAHSGLVPTRCAGCAGLRPSKADVPLIWFDHLIRNAGPLIPLPIMMIHW